MFALGLHTSLKIPTLPALYYNNARQIGEADHIDSIIMITEGGYGLIGEMKLDSAAASGHYKNALKIAKFTNNEAYQLKVWCYIAGLYTDFSAPEEAVAALNEALPLAILLKKKDKEAEIYNLFGASYGRIGQIDMELAYLNRSVNINDSLHLYDQLARNYNQIEIIYSQQKKYLAALLYGNKVDSIYGITGNAYGKNQNYLQMGSIYYEMGKYDDAIGLYNKGAAYFKTDPLTEMYFYTSLGKAYLHKNEFVRARQYLLQALELNNNAHNGKIDYIANRNLAEVFLKLNVLDSALYYAKYNEGKVGGKGYSELYQDCTDQLARIYEAMSDVKNSNAYHNKFEDMQDTVRARLRHDKVAEQEVRFKPW